MFRGTIPAIPIDMRSLIEAGEVALQGVRSLHDAITRIRASGSFDEPGGSQRVFHPPTSSYLSFSKMWS